MGQCWIILPDARTGRRGKQTDAGRDGTNFGVSTSLNVRQWIQRATTTLQSAPLFYGHGTDNPSDEAAWLVLHAVDAKLDGSFEAWDLQLTREQENRLRNNLAARVERGVPLAYVLGCAWFAGLEFEVDPAVLIPRSPIAELIQEDFSPWIDASALENALDLCTGSGCIGIAMAVRMPWLVVDAADISPESLAVARRNIKKHGVESRVRPVLSDLFGGLAGLSYDLIVTNPPYVPRSALQSLPREYRAEPELGLVSGSDGLDACLKIMLQSPHHLRAGGVLVCEVGEAEQALVELLPTVPFIWLEFSSGGHGVFMLTRQELMQSSSAIKNVIEDRVHVT